MINEYDKKEYYEYLSAKDLESRRKTPLILAILGLLFGAVMGFGIIFSVISVITYFTNKKLGGTSLKWGLVLGVLGLVLNLMFIASIVIVLTLQKIPMPLF